jgi:4-hydroxybenzoate polyprenyltransferase
MRDWLRLVRISGLATIGSNLAAAVLWSFYAGEGLDLKWLWRVLADDPAHTGWMLLASALLYAAGMAWNDLADVERDRVIHPERPLPSGRLPLPLAVVGSALLGVGAVVAALLAEGLLGMTAALTVLILALLYNLQTKHTPWLGAVNLGLVRAAHACFALLLVGPDLLRAALVAADPPGVRCLLLYPALLFTYTVGLSVIAELEHRAGRRIELLAGGLLMAAGVGGAVIQLAGAGWARTWWQTGGLFSAGAVLCMGFGLLAAVLLIWAVGRPLWAAVTAGSRTGAGRTLVAGLGGIILFDAVLAAAAHPIGLLLILLYPLFGAVARAIRMD